jgi:hypothetical protein
MKEMHFICTLFQPSISLVKETIQDLKCAEFISEAEINMRIVDGVPTNTKGRVK